MRRRLPLLCVLLVAVLVGACGRGDRPEHVLLISIDTLRADHVGAYGYDKGTTPNLDRLAADGAVFLRSYAQAASTAPSHVSIFTSVVPSVHGVVRHGGLIDPKMPVLAGLLRDAGFATAGFTQLNGDETYNRGFDVWQRLPGGTTEGIASLEEPLAWLREKVAAGERTFLFLHTYAVHLPYDPPAEEVERFYPGYEGKVPRHLTRRFLDKVNSGKITLHAEDVRYIKALYDTQLAIVDGVLGGLFQDLRELGTWDDTLVVVLSDHGEEFGDHGGMVRHAHNLYDEILRTPLIVAGPGVPGGRRIETRVANLDVTPTILEAVGVDPPKSFMGRPLQRVWSGEEAADREVVAERNRELAVVSGDLKLHEDGRLFDLADDPGETRDLAVDRPGDAALMQQRRARVDAAIARLQQNVERRGEEKLTPEDVERLKALGYL